MLGYDYKMTINFNPPLLKILLKYLKPQKGEKILDIGCNRGFYVRELEKYTKNVIGIDIDGISLKNAVTGKVKYNDATNLSFEDNYFDKIYSLHVTEHIQDVKKFLEGVAKVLKPGGIFIIVYPWELFRGMQAIGFALVRYKNPFLARKVHLHKFSPKKIKQIIKNTPFSHIKSKLVFTLKPPSLQYLTVFKKIVSDLTIGSFTKPR